MRIQHQTYGLGTVLAVEGLFVLVRFDSLEGKIPGWEYLEGRLTVGKKACRRI